ncbi:hypothetical protein FOA52_009755 [Chlamydomonas sp. UWO 241]|nr:hypothetical protein FOA52_009755 [Chlamydomonas sp. UWO 241]
MEIYYTTQIEKKVGRVAKWSKAQGYPPLLAVALLPSSAGIYNEEGRPHDPNNEALIKNIRGSEAMCFAWHPLLPLLAIGWKDGAISFWNAEERHLEEDSKTHRSPLSSMTWNASGDKLFTSDENAKMAVWKTDRMMRPIHIVSYDEQPGCTIRSATLGPTEPSPDGTPGVTSSVYYGVDLAGVTIVKWANDQGYTGVVQEFDTLVDTIIYYHEKDQLVVTTGGCTLHVLGKDEADQSWAQLSKMRFATGTGEQAAALQVCWGCEHTLASASDRDAVIRLYNFDTEDNYTLAPDGVDGQPARIVCLASDLRSGLLAAGTSDGAITVFKYTAPPSDGEPVLDFAKCWDSQPSFRVTGRVKAMEWGINPRLMCVSTEEGVSACRKMLLNHRFRDGFVVIQSGVDKLIVERVSEGDKDQTKPPARLEAKMQMLGLDISKGQLLVYDGTRADLYKVTDQGEITPVGGFQCASRAMAICNDSVFRAADDRIEVTNTAGTIKQTLAFDDIQGSPTVLSICRDYLAAVTTNNYVRVFKVAGREAKPHAGPGLIIPIEFQHLKVDQVACNASGSMVSVLCSSKETATEPKMFVFCSETNATVMYDFATDGRQPQRMVWDVVEPKLLAVQVLNQQADDLMDIASSGGAAPGGSPIEVALMFVSPDHGVLIQEYQSLAPSGARGFIGLQAPHLVLNKPSAVTTDTGRTFTTNSAKVIMQGFDRMQSDDEQVRSALLEFSYNLAINNMDEAFRAVKQIKSTAVWGNMAHLCIKNKRLDVAEHCLGKMENARGARAAREAKSIAELDARVASVAVHLGMVEDAKKMYIAADRYDLLNRLFRASGHWDKALEVAEKNDRIHLKSTHYAYAQHLEKTGEFDSALAHYEQAGAASIEVPRMYFEIHEMEKLEAYIKKKGIDDKELTLWWARYCESLEDKDKAYELYESVGDVLSVVRIMCYSGKFTAACEEVERQGDPAAAFHLARQYEAQERIPDAIKYYTQAKRFSHGVRLAKKYELDSDLMNLALKSTPLVMIDAADYLNERGEHDKAATLYMKGGKLSKAVEMCFAAKLFDVLQHIAEHLEANDDPGLFMRCSEFFLQHGEFEKAVKMLIAANQYTRALEMCIEQEVVITDDMAEAMTPSKDVMSAEERNLTLQRIAKVAKRQGSWQLAAKKYTQAGEKVKAMKALLRSGDTEKIVFFAGVSRHKDIYMMAANYLQTLDWHSNPEIMKNVIQFYSKAQAMDNLAAFYEACAQIEIDEYRDYEKALQALHEAGKYLSKSKSEDMGEKSAHLNQRVALIERFVTARGLITTDAKGAISICNEVLMSAPTDSDASESGVRVGDVFALMIEYWYEAKNAGEAYKLVDAMRGRGIAVGPYLDQRMVEEIHKALGLDAPTDHLAAANNAYAASQARNSGAYADGGVEEEIPDDLPEIEDDDM